MKFLNGILKWLATLAFTLASGLLVIILLSNEADISPLLMRLAIVAAISLMCSLLLRLFYPRGISFLLIVLGFISATFSTLVIDHFYDTEFTLSFLTDTFTFQVPSVQDIAQLVILLLLSLPALLLFKKRHIKRQVVEPAKTSATQVKGPTLSDHVKVAAYRINPKNWNLHLPTARTAKRKTASVKTAPVSNRTAVHVASSAKTVAIKPAARPAAAKSTPQKKLKLPKFGGKTANNDVKLMGDEEHVCPYCLEEVAKNDSRGIAICKECGTWHHQDCWDVTGACGVAHRNKL
jgi:ribosomal protein L37AE/L43A